MATDLPDIRQKRYHDMNYYIYETILGQMTAVSNDYAITELKRGSVDNPLYTKARTDLLDTAALQLAEYLSGKRQCFDVPLHPSGTVFQISVWKALQTIPYGETRSYRQIAAQIGNKKAYRAVGMANNKNPIWIIIPCHRVIGADGSLTGYGGGLDMKKRLLQIEKMHRDKAVFRV